MLTGGFFFFDAGRLADLVGQVIQATAADDTALAHFDAFHPWAVQQKRLLNSHAVRYATDGDRFIGAAAFTNGYDAFKHLHALFTALENFGKDPDRVARAKLRKSVLFLFFFDKIDDVHESFL